MTELVKEPLSAKQIAWVIAEYEKAGGDRQNDADGFFQYLLDDPTGWVSDKCVDLITQHTEAIKAQLDIRRCNCGCGGPDGDCITALKNELQEAQSNLAEAQDHANGLTQALIDREKETERLKKSVAAWTYLKPTDDTTEALVEAFEASQNETVTHGRKLNAQNSAYLDRLERLETQLEQEKARLALVVDAIHKAPEVLERYLDTYGPDVVAMVNELSMVAHTAQEQVSSYRDTLINEGIEQGIQACIDRLNSNPVYTAPASGDFESGMDAGFEDSIKILQSLQSNPNQINNSSPESYSAPMPVPESNDSQIKSAPQETRPILERLLALEAGNKLFKGELQNYIDVVSLQDDGECSNCGFSHSYSWGFPDRFTKALSLQSNTTGLLNVAQKAYARHKFKPGFDLFKLDVPLDQACESLPPETKQLLDGLEGN